MFKLNDSIWLKTLSLVLFAFSMAGWQSCTPNANNTTSSVNSAATPPRNVNAVSTSNSNSETESDVKVFSRYFETEILIDPPPTTGSGEKFVPIAEIQSRLKITSLKQTAIVLTPQRNSVTIESVELAIYSADKTKVFSLPATAASKRRTFEPVVKPSGANIAGYVFNFDEARIAEADKFFVPENIIKVIPVFGREKPATAIFYLVDRESEIIKRD